LPVLPTTLNYEGDPISCANLTFAILFLDDSDLSLQFSASCRLSLTSTSFVLLYNVSFLGWNPQTWHVGPNFFFVDNLLSNVSRSISTLEVVYNFGLLLFDALLVPRIWRGSSNSLQGILNGTTGITNGTMLTYTLEEPSFINIYNTQDYGITFDPTDPKTCSLIGEAVESSNGSVPSIANLPACSLFSWFFTVWAYVALSDFGQLLDPASIDDMNWPFLKPSQIQQNNIFVNDTIFQRYKSVLLNEILPDEIGNLSSVVFHGHLNQTVGSIEAPIALDLTYLCSQRMLKGWLSLFISVLAADAALILGAHSLFILVAGHIQKRKDQKEPGNPMLPVLYR